MSLELKNGWSVFILHGEQIWRAARAAFVSGRVPIQRGYCRLTLLVRSSFIQQVCRCGFSVFVKNIMALSSVGLYSAIQMEVKAATVQWLRSTSQLERFVLINAENEASKRTEHMEGFCFFCSSDKCSESVTKVTQVDCNFGGQHWNVKVCVSETQFQAFWLHCLSTLEELPHAYKLILTHKHR